MAQIDYFNDSLVVLKADGSLARVPAIGLLRGLLAGENRVRDPTFSDATLWAANILPSDDALWATDKIVEVTGDAGLYKNARSSVFVVTPGEKLLVSCKARVSSGSGAGAYISIYTSASPDMSSAVQNWVASTTSTVPTDISGIITVPSTARYGKLYFLKPGNASVTACQFSHPRVITDPVAAVLASAIDLTAS